MLRDWFKNDISKQNSYVCLLKNINKWINNTKQKTKTWTAGQPPPKKIQKKTKKKTNIYISTTENFRS